MTNSEKLLAITKILLTYKKRLFNTESINALPPLSTNATLNNNTDLAKTKAFLEQQKDNPFLSVLDLSGTMISDSTEPVLTLLVYLIEHSLSLHTLILSNCLLGEETWKIADALAKNHRILFLDMRYNDLSTRVATKFLHCIGNYTQQSSKSIVKLELSPKTNTYQELDEFEPKINKALERNQRKQRQYLTLLDTISQHTADDTESQAYLDARDTLIELVEQGVSIHTQNSQGQTLIHLAIRLLDQHLVRIVVEKFQPNLRMKDICSDDGYDIFDTVWDMASTFEATEIISDLADAGEERSHWNIRRTTYKQQKNTLIRRIAAKSAIQGPLTNLEELPLHFVERRTAEEQLHERLVRESLSRDGHQQTICGPAGSGKYTLVKSFAMKGLSAKRYQFARCIQADRHNLEVAFITFAIDLGFKDTDLETLPVESLVQAVFLKLENYKFILIFRNVKDPNALERFLPSENLKPNQHILITSKETQRWPLSGRTPLKAFTLEETIQFVRSALPGRCTDQDASQLHTHVRGNPGTLASAIQKMRMNHFSHNPISSWIESNPSTTITEHPDNLSLPKSDTTPTQRLEQIANTILSITLPLPTTPTNSHLNEQGSVSLSELTNLLASSTRNSEQKSSSIHTNNDMSQNEWTGTMLEHHNGVIDRTKQFLLAVSNNIFLESLDLQHSILPEALVKILSEILKKTKSLHSLCLGNCLLNENAGWMLADAVHENQSLIQVDLSQNDIGTRAVRKFVTALVTDGCKSLTQLQVSATQLENSEFEHDWPTISKLLNENRRREHRYRNLLVRLDTYSESDANEDDYQDTIHSILDLLNSGVSVHTRGTQGKTLLHIAITKADSALVSAVLNQKKPFFANLAMRDLNGGEKGWNALTTLWFTAKRYRAENVLSMLESSGIKSADSTTCEEAHERESTAMLMEEKQINMQAKKLNNPISVCSDFIPRPELIAKLEWRLNQTGSGMTNITQSEKKNHSSSQSLTGLGGVGKTQLAAFFVNRAMLQGEYDFCHWMVADKLNLRSEFIRLAMSLGFEQNELKHLDNARLALTVYQLIQSKRYILVLDDGGADSLKDFLPGSTLRPKQHILVTSRNNLECENMEALSVDTFTDRETQNYIRQDGYIPEATAEECLILHQRFDGLPLAIAEAVAYIVSKAPSDSSSKIKWYLQVFEENLEKVIQNDSRFSQLRRAYPNSLLTTWTLARTEVQKNATAFQIFQLGAFFSSQSIPIGFFVFCYGEADANEGLRLLLQFGLVRLDYSSNTLHIHCTVQEIERFKQTIESKFQENISLLLAKVWAFTKGASPMAPDTWERAKNMLPHLKCILKYVNIDECYNNKEDGVNLFRVYSSAASIATNVQEYDTTKELYETCLIIGRKVYGEDHPELGKILMNLGVLYDCIGKPRERKSLIEQALAIYRKANSPDELLIAMALIQLGDVCGELGERDQQITLQKQAITIREEHLGKQDELVAEALVSLSTAYDDEGGYEERKNLLVRALDILESNVGQEHPKLIGVLVNLGNVHGNLGDAQQKIYFLERAKNICAKFFGENHSSMAAVLTNLGVVYGVIGDMSKYRLYLNRALAIYEELHGPNSPHVVTPLINMTLFDEAMPTLDKITRLDRVVKILKETYGDAHHLLPDTLTNLSIMYGRIGDFQKKKELLEEAIVLIKRKYGSDHKKLAIPLTNLGIVHGQLGNNKEEIAALEQALKIKEATYGTGHLEVAITLTNLGNAYSQTNATKQKQCLQRALNIKRKECGDHHPEVALTLMNLGLAYGSESNYNKQVECQEEALEIQLSTYGAKDSNVALTRVNLARGFFELGILEKASNHANKGLAIFIDIYGSEHHHTAFAQQTVDLIYSRKVSHDLPGIIMTGRPDQVLSLINEQTINQTFTDEPGDTPLTLSLRHKRLDVADSLLSYGANINKANRNNETPLMIAAVQGMENQCAIFLALGASTTPLNTNGDTAILLALQHGHLTVATLLLEAEPSHPCYQQIEQLILLVHSIVLNTDSEAYKDELEEIKAIFLSTVSTSSTLCNEELPPTPGNAPLFSDRNTPSTNNDSETNNNKNNVTRRPEA